MAFPNLLPKPDARNPDGTSIIWAQATGIPTNGLNVIGLPFVSQGVAPNDIVEDWLDIRVDALGPLVTYARFVTGSLTPDKLFITIDFGQSGADQALVQARIFHSMIS